MSNPWLTVPLADYERHMSSSEVRQLGVLSDLFAESLRKCSPPSVAILGIAGGNGLEHIDPELTVRIVGVDLNPQYLEAVRERYSHLPGLELHCVDLAEQSVPMEPVQLVHAALIFEHAGTGRCLESALSCIAPGGNFSVVLQLPTQSGQDIGASAVLSIQILKSHFSLISPDSLIRTLDQRGLSLTQEQTRSLPEGKAFWMGIFSAPEGPLAKQPAC